MVCAFRGKFNIFFLINGSWLLVVMGVYTHMNISCLSLIILHWFCGPNFMLWYMTKHVTKILIFSKVYFYGLTANHAEQGQPILKGQRGQAPPIFNVSVYKKYLDEFLHLCI
jgi:hypothetical protein